MDNRERPRLMDAVLDGEATPAEVRELDRLLAADPTARTEFEQLKRIFDGLSEIPQAFAPEGLVASVLANIPQNPPPRDCPDQLLSGSRVIGAATKEARGKTSGKSVKGSPAYRPVPHSREWSMNEQSSGSRRRNVWIGSSIAMGAALIALAYTIDFPPGAQNVVGTIVPAQRFKAAQPAMDDIKAGGQAASQAVPLQAGSAANAAATSAVTAGQTNQTITNSQTGNAVTAAGTVNAVTESQTNKVIMNSQTGNAVTAAGTLNAVTGSQTNKVIMNSQTGNAVTAAGTLNAVTESQTNKVIMNSQTGNAVTAAGTLNAIGQSTTNAVTQSTSNAINSSVQQGVTNATSNAVKQ